MVEEFNLSKNIIRRTLDFDIHGDSGYDMFYLFDVKEFIRLLKEEFLIEEEEAFGIRFIIEAIDKLAGNKLI